MKIQPVYYFYKTALMDKAAYLPTEDLSKAKSICEGILYESVMLYITLFCSESSDKPRNSTLLVCEKTTEKIDGVVSVQLRWH